MSDTTDNMRPKYKTAADQQTANDLQDMLDSGDLNAEERAEAEAAIKDLQDYWKEPVEAPTPEVPEVEIPTAEGDGMTYDEYKQQLDLEGDPDPLDITLRQSPMGEHQERLFLMRPDRIVGFTYTPQFEVLVKLNKEEAPVWIPATASNMNQAKDGEVRTVAHVVTGLLMDWGSAVPCSLQFGEYESMVAWAAGGFRIEG